MERSLAVWEGNPSLEGSAKQSFDVSLLLALSSFFLRTLDLRMIWDAMFRHYCASERFYRES